MEYSNHY
jgi:hypothetical protein